MKDKNIPKKQREDQKSTFPMDLSIWTALLELELLIEICSNV